MVGGGALTCPFCGAPVQVTVQRLVGSSGAPRSRAEGHKGRARQANITFETLAEAALKDKLPTALPGLHPAPGVPAVPPIPAVPGFKAAPPPEPPPPPAAEGPPRLGWLFVAPRRFFRSLERGRPSVAPQLGWVILAAAGAVQGAAFAWVWPGALAPAEQAGRAGAAALAFAGFLYVIYRLGLTLANAPDDVARRLPRVLGYGFIPAALGLVPLLGLPFAVGAASRAHAAGLEHHVGVRRSDAGLLVGLSWLCFGLMLWMVR